MIWFGLGSRTSSSQVTARNEETESIFFFQVSIFQIILSISQSLSFGPPANLKLSCETPSGVPLASKSPPIVVTILSRCRDRPTDLDRLEVPELDHLGNIGLFFSKNLREKSKARKLQGRIWGLKGVHALSGNGWIPLNF